MLFVVLGLIDRVSVLCFPFQLLRTYTVTHTFIMRGADNPMVTESQRSS